MHTENAWTKEKASALLEWLFLLVTAIYLVCQCVYQSTYVLPSYTFPDRPVFQLILCAAAVLALGKTALNGLWNFRTGLLALTAAGFFLAYRTGRELFLLMIPVLMAGTAGVDYRKVLKVYLAAVGSFLAVTILCSFTGVIPNIVYAGAGRFRSSWGNAYPTDFASLVLFFVMMLWLSWKKMPATLALLGGLLALWIAFAITDSRTSALCGLMFLVLLAYDLFSQRFEAEKNGGAKFGKCVGLLMAFSFVIFAAAFWGLLILFARGSEAAARFDSLFSGRLTMTLLVLRNEGISAFGSNYSQVGLGGATIQAGEYYFLDSSYAMLLVRYGWVLFAAVTALWTGMGLRAFRAGDRKLLCVMTVIAFHALSEHHFPDVQYNMLLALPFASIPLGKTTAAEARIFSDRIRKNRGGICCAAVLITAAGLAAPLGLSRLRTVFDIWGTESPSGELRAVLWCVLLLLSTGTGAVTLCLLSSRLRKRQSPDRKKLVMLVLGMAVLTGIVLTDSHVIRLADDPDRISAEKAKALEQILDSASGKVVVNEEPELLRSHYPGISRSIWYGQDLAREKEISVVVNLEEDNIAFSKTGFQFTQITHNEAIVSNDPSAIAGLTAAGYEWTPFDAAVREVNLKAFAEFNGLEVTEQGSIVLENGKKLNHGPYLDFYTGTYRVIFDLKADIGVKSDNPLGLVYVATLDGKSLAENSIKAENLNRDGTGSVEVIFQTKDIRYLQFPVFPAEGQNIEITGIRYQRIG